jgi:hypothetical protein
MTVSVPLTATALREHVSDFHVYEEQLALELGGLSGLQINELTFARLTKPDPLRLFGLDCDGEEVLMMGTDQRDMLVPKLAETLLVLPTGGYVLDIGSGADHQLCARRSIRATLLRTAGSDEGQPSAVPGPFPHLPS